ncbi:MAG: hypothetical protein U0S36_05445 [Candidatus Nanopelagicales bacterium]
MRGRPASVIGLLLCLGYVAPGGGEAVAGSTAPAARRRPTSSSPRGTSSSPRSSPRSDYGYRWLVLVNKLIVPIVGAVMLVTVAAVELFDVVRGTPDAYLLGDFGRRGWPR